MKILHIADIHYCTKHLKWVSKAMANAVDAAIAEGCEIAIIAGDSFDSALSVHDPAFVDFLGQVLRLGNHMPTIILQGTPSHDRPGSLDCLKKIYTEHRIIVADRPDHLVVDGAMVSVLPSLNKSDPDVMRVGANEWVRQHLSRAAEVHQDARRRGILSILVTHGTVTGCTTESGWAMVSPDHEFSIETLALADADAVMLGHIHRHQSWPGVRTPSGAQTTIAYPGSLARLVHGHHEPVGYLIWDIESESTAFEFRESPSRQLLEISFDGPPNIDELRELAKTAGQDDAVRIRWEIDEECAGSVDKTLIRELFGHAESVKLEPRVLPIQRVRAEGIGNVKTLADKLQYWCRTTNSDARANALADRLSILSHMDIDQVVKTVSKPNEVRDSEAA